MLIDPSSRVRVIDETFLSPIRSAIRALGRVVPGAGLVLGPLLFILVLSLPIPELSQAGKGVLGVTLWMAVWWLAETVPLYMTALLPLVLFPLLDVPELRGALPRYADDVVFLFLGGFLLARAIERSKLDQRFALQVLSVFGSSPGRVVAGFMIATATMSSLISNTATTVLMLPIAVAVIARVEDRAERERFGTCLMLCLAYSASLGGMSTLIGTPPNAILASLARELAGVEVSFARWMLVGMPTSIVSLVVVWWYTVNYGAGIAGVKMSTGREVINERLARLGNLSRDEQIVTAVVATTALAWLTRGFVWQGLLPSVTDSTVVVAAALVLFLLPSTSGGRLLDWEAAVGIPWGVLLLVGGGLCLAAGFAITGLDVWIAHRLLFLQHMPIVVVIVTIAGATLITSEIISNTATAALLLPIAASLAMALDMNPILLMIPATFASTYAFTLPVATPPNAIVFGSGYLTARKMARAGFPLDLIGIGIVTVSALVLVPLVWG